MTAIGVVFAALIGLAFGSFLNVCISRLPQHESVVSPRSRCPHCRAPIVAYDNVPLLSWMVLGGRCRKCGQPISIRYPLIEAAVAGLFVLCFLYNGYTIHALGAAIFCWFLVGLCATDAETLLLPDAFTLPGLALGLIYQAVSAGGTAEHRLQGAGRAAIHASVAACCAALLLLLVRWIYWAVRRRTGLGLGDVKLFAMIAAWLGFRLSALVLFLAVLSGAVYGLAWIAFRNPGRNAEPARIPFGVFLCLAALFSMFLGYAALAWYSQFFVM